MAAGQQNGSPSRLAATCHHWQSHDAVAAHGGEVGEWKSASKTPVVRMQRCRWPTHQLPAEHCRAGGEGGGALFRCSNTQGMKMDLCCVAGIALNSHQLLEAWFASAPLHSHQPMCRPKASTARSSAPHRLVISTLCWSDTRCTVMPCNRWNASASSAVALPDPAGAAVAPLPLPAAAEVATDARRKSRVWSFVGATTRNRARTAVGEAPSRATTLARPGPQTAALMRELIMVPRAPQTSLWEPKPPGRGNVSADGTRHSGAGSAYTNCFAAQPAAVWVGF